MFHISSRTSLSTSRWDNLDAAVRRVVAEHATGSLVVDGDRESATLYFEDGNIIFALGYGDGANNRIDPSWFATTPGNDTADGAPPEIGEMIDEVVRSLRDNGSVTIGFSSAVSPVRTSAEFETGKWFDLDEPAPFALCPLTRIA